MSSVTSAMKVKSTMTTTQTTAFKFTILKKVISKSLLCRNPSGKHDKNNYCDIALINTFFGEMTERTV